MKEWIRIQPELSKQPWGALKRLHDERERKKLKEN